MPPIYIYQHPETEEVVELFQGMNDQHEHFSEDGTKWNRIYSVPSVTRGSQTDPFSQDQFVEKTKGNVTVGDMWDHAAEMSEKRKDMEGYDPIKKKAREEYQEKYKGKAIPKELED